MARGRKGRQERSTTRSSRQTTRQNKENATPAALNQHAVVVNDNLASTKADSASAMGIFEDIEIHLDSDADFEARHPAEANKLPAAAQQTRPQRQSSQDAVSPASPTCPRHFFVQRLLDIHSPAAAALKLRPHLQGVLDKLCEVLCNAVELGHSNSVLMIGPRGSGKSLALERCLHHMNEKYNSVVDNPQVGVVRLTGLMHADDRTAVKEIARQMCHLFGGTFLKAASFADNLLFLKDIFTELKKCAKFLVFVLDEFDLFAHRSKQTLLYTLLDTMRHTQAQAVVVGLTCRHDVVELLEKRVQSRFSHRKILVYWGENDTGNSVPDVLRSMLQLPTNFPNAQFAAAWNHSLERTLESPQLVERMKELAFTGCSPQELSQMCVLVVSGLPQGAVLQPHDILRAVQDMADMTNSQASMVSGLSVLELYMLIALYRLTRNNVETINFEVAFEEYATHASIMTGSVDQFNKAAAFRAFEHLLCLALAAPVNGRRMTRFGLMEYQPVQLLVDEYEIRAGLQGHPNIPDTMKQWMDQQAVAKTAYID